MRARLIRRHRGAAGPQPVGQVLVAPRPVNLDDRQIAVLPDLPDPVDPEARRAHDQEMRRPRIFERHHRGDRLHGLAETHFIAQEHISLVQDVLDTPLLVAAERAFETLRKQLLVLDLPRELLREPVGPVAGAEEPRRDLLDHREKRNRLLLKIRPGLVLGPPADCVSDRDDLLSGLPVVAVNCFREK